MIDFDYTLNQPIFRYALKKTPESQNVFSDGRKLMVVGGVATQLTIVNESHLLRPTNDIDVIANGPTSKPERREWANRLSQIVSQEGFPNHGGLSRYGGEVRFEGLKNDLIVHLDCFGSNYFDRHKRRIDAEFERAEIANVEGSNVAYQCPLDIITNKVRRILSLEYNGLSLDSNTTFFIDLLKDGLVDDIETTKFRKDVEGLALERQRNIEDLGRLDYREVFEQVQGYKVRKDIYDICMVLESSRKAGKPFNKKEFIGAVKLATLDLE